ncbi:MAG: 23S rRNA (adenine(2503)-C(2))-methyltransferase RlmN [Bacteroidales bacterium]|nr:MAG: 23S rRNA (adenine(2503)-C(2))-methyltransferase RlmN [Bacteroidales bacterium]
MEQKEKPEIRDLKPGDIQAFFQSRGEKKYRSDQVLEWLWKKGAVSFGEMTNLPLPVRELLQQAFTINAARMEITQTSRDGTVKIGFRLADNLLVEGVLIPSGSRATACISSQAGCPLGCVFCATGIYGYRRNLTAGEIFDQVVALNELSVLQRKKPLSNVVLMGMGEPLLNYENVMQAIYRLTSETGLGISPHRITLSTVGISDRIKQMGDDRVKINLAVSLHTANKLKRDAIVPVNKSNPLSSLSSAVKYFYDKTKTRITFEYILLKDFNDGISDAKELAAFCRIVPCKINLIEYNPAGKDRFRKSSAESMNHFKEFLESKNLIVNIRKSRGADIDAACGQLANKSKNR